MDKVRKKRRTEVACVECRRRKLKCEGTRPDCSRCLHLRLKCNYAPSRGGIPAARARPDRDDLLKRIEVLEEQLKMVTERPTAGVAVRRNDQEIFDQKTAVEEEVAVDVLSTFALTETLDSEVGYFGPSSNYAMFRLLARIFARTSTTYLPADATVKDLGSCHHCAQRHGEAAAGSRDPVQAEAAPAHGLHALPSNVEALALIDGYFSTINLVLPYVDKSILLRDYNRAMEQHPPRFRKPFLALLDIVWAHASESMGSADREIFYERAVALLDSRTLGRPSYELVQALLLLVEYEQNHQRSISSYTTHALCVKAAFQVGLHLRAVEGDTGQTDLRLRLWQGVVKNDRILGLTQGRPFMIPPSLAPVNEARIEGISTLGNLYMISLASSYPIIEQAVGALYSGNLAAEGVPSIESLIPQWTLIDWQVEDWSDSLAAVGGLIQASALPSCSVIGGSTAVQMLLTIQYHRMRMLVSFPLITLFLQMKGEDSGDARRLGRLRQVLPRVVQESWSAIRELGGLISALVNIHKTFTSTFAACLLLTVALHYLAILLVTKYDPTILDATSVGAVRGGLEEALGVMEVLGQSSLITSKSRCCVRRLLTVFDALGDRPSVSSSDPFDFGETDYVMRNIGWPSDDFASTFGLDEFEQHDPSFIDLYSCIPLGE